MSPLVSIVVVTYNSGQFIFETLESIKFQTYRAIELVITDDASMDSTVQVCSVWLEENKERFVRTKLITSEINTGISGNFNRGFLEAKGFWIKAISGDDGLMPNCISDNMEYVLNNPQIKVLFSFNRVYDNVFTEDNYSGLNPYKYPINIITSEITAHQQYLSLLRSNKITFTPTAFIERNALLESGLPDEDLFSEDYQLFLKLTSRGYKLHFMEKETVMYRKHATSINNTVDEYIIKPHYFKTEKFRRRYIYRNVPFDIRMSRKFSWCVNQIFKIKALNRRSNINGHLHYFLNVLLNPFAYIILLKRSFFKKYQNNIFYK